jgi:alkylation response protein AidB-like acyl-CoA dehydrogenase
LFSEPGAGSDLASLETRARKIGDRWIVNGQKVWSSFAHESGWAILLARTEDIPRHGGLTFFVVNMDQPGIEVRPLVQMNGGTEFNEVFLDEVVVEDRDMIGSRGEGWAVALTALQAERSGLAGSVVIGPGESDRLVASAIATDRWRNPGVRARLTKLMVEERVHQMNMLRASRAGTSAPFPSVLKLFHSELHERLGRAAADVDPLGATAWTSESSGPATDFLSAKYLTIPGGTSEIQRNLISERVLGQPRDPRPPMS